MLTALTAAAKNQLSGMNETRDTLLWIWRSFTDTEARHYFVRANAWTVAAELSKLSQPWLLGYGLLGIFNHDAWTCISAFGLTMFLQGAGILFQWRAARFRELLIGQNVRVLDHVINTSFFAKELGLHVEENAILCQSSMEKGRERAERVCHTITFTGIETVVTLVATFVILVALKPLAGAIVLAVLFVSVAISLFMNNEVMSGADPIEADFRAIIRRRNERWDAVERVLTNGKGDEEVADLDRRFGDVLNRPNGDRATWLKYIDRTPIREFVNLGGFGIVTLYVGFQAWKGVATQSELVSVAAWSIAVMTQVRAMARLEREITFCMPAIKRMRAALELPKRVFDAPDAIDLPKGPVEVTLEAVSHGYRGKGNVLSNISFTVGKGESAALIGRSGCGKSTITRLLQRYFDPTAGRILVNGIDLRKIRHASWERLVAYIPQKPQILDGTLRDNLVYGLSPKERDAWNDERLWAFVRRFKVDFGEARLEKGLDTMVGKRGVELSGGEAQRVMIAAAAMRGAEFYIIDEATSSLDAEMQDEVQSALYELLNDGASALIIAHRLSTLMRCDKFIVMQPAATAAANNKPQIEATAHSMIELSRISPIFRQLAQRERILRDLETESAAFA